MSFLYTGSKPRATNLAFPTGRVLSRYISDFTDRDNFSRFVRLPSSLFKSKELNLIKYGGIVRAKGEFNGMTC
jgi:hypothetical protein